MYVRKAVYLKPAQNRLLQRLAAQNNTSEAEILRRAIDYYGLARGTDPLEALIGDLRSGKPTGRPRVKP